MNPVLDLLLAGAYGTMTPEVEQLFFVVGPKALPSPNRFLRVRQGADRNGPRQRPLPGSSESAAWGASPAERYFQRRLREEA
jgi:hypothetical protein